MAEHSDSLRSLVQGLLEDTRDLMRSELALAKAEIREEVSTIGTVGAAFGGAAAAALLGLALLALAVGGGLAFLLKWPAWTGYGIVAVVLLIGAWLMVTYGRKQLKNIRTLPKTTQTMRENLEWIQNRSIEGKSSIRP